MVQGTQIEVGGFVPGTGGGPAVLIQLKEEKLQLWTNIEVVEPHGLGPAQNPAQNAPGVPHEGGAVCIVHITEHPGYLSPRHLRRQDREAVQVWIQALIRLVNTGKALDGGTVKHDLVVHRLLNLRRGNRHIFHLAENIGKLHPNKFNFFPLDDADNVLFCIGHGIFPLFPDFGT